MAVAGDVIIKLAADVAELKQGLGEANRSLDELGQHAQDAGRKVESSITAGTFKGLAIHDIVTEAIQQLRKLATDSEAASLAIAKQATSLKVSTDAMQAYQLMAKQSGMSVEQVTKQLKDNGDATQRLVEYYRSLGLIIDAEAVAKFARMNAAAEEASRRIDAIIAPLFATVKETILDGIANTLQRIKELVNTIDITRLDVLMKLALLPLNPAAGLLGLGLLPGTQSPASQEIDRLNTELAETVRHLADLRSGNANPMPMIGRDAEIAMYEKKLDELQAKRAALTQPVPTMPPVTITAPPEKGGGGGGRNDNDNLQAQIDRYRALGEAAGRAYDDVRARHLPLVEDIQRELRVQQEVEQVAARLGAKYKDADESLKKQLHDAVDGWLRAKEASAEYVRQVQAAEDINAKFGDGTTARARAQRELDRARAGGADPQALARASKQRQEQIDQEAAAARRYDDDLGSLTAGLESAMLTWTRANDLFSVGQQAFNGFTNAMGEGLDALAGKSNKTFEDIAGDFALMLAKMAAQAAMSQIFSQVFGSFGGQTGAGGMGPPTPGTGIFGWIGSLFGGNRAVGGPVQPGVSYLVGENGPERFVPAAAGTIQPMSKEGGASIGNVVVNVDMAQTTGARDPASALEFGRKLKAAVVDVIQGEQRPGGTLYAR